MSGILTGDCLDVIAGMEPESVDAIVTDPPYGLEFMGKEWDSLTRGDVRQNWDDPLRFGDPKTQAHARMKVRYGYGTDPSVMQDWHHAWATAALRVAKPGAYLLAFGGTRTYHRLACAIEDAGWIIRDCLVWAYACLSDDTEILTSEGWVRYNRTSEGQLAAAFDPATGRLRWERIQFVHQYHHEGQMAEIGPSLVTLNHRVVLDEATARVPRLPGMWTNLHPLLRMGEEGKDLVLLDYVQREGQAAGPAFSDRNSSRLDCRFPALLSRVDERPQKPRLEGRRYRVQEAWELLGRAVRESAGLGEGDGPEGRLRDGASARAGDRLRLSPYPQGVREPREPRPHGQPSREPEPLAGQPDAQALRVGQVPTGDGEPDSIRLVDYAGTVWCITVPSGAFVARRNGVVFVTGNSGFPKSKASLKPAWEPVVLARKPGPLRNLAIDECRIGTTRDVPASLSRDKTPHGIYNDGLVGIEDDLDPNRGRWPANVILTDPIFDGDRGFDGKPRWDGVVGGGETTSGGRSWDVGADKVNMWGNVHTRRTDYDRDGDTGTYSRFFLIPKASRGDREPLLPGCRHEWEHVPGLSDMGSDVWVCSRCQAEVSQLPKSGSMGHRRCAKCGRQSECKCPDPEWVPAAEAIRRENTHPTVKPLELMRHLVRLVTPQGGTVLDPFLGSGTTALAAEQEGFAWIGIEREPEYVAIAEARLALVQRGLGI